MTAPRPTNDDGGQSAESRAIEAIVFDFGNVLYRFDNAILWREVAALTNGRSTAEDVRRFIYETDFDRLVNRGRYTPEEMFARLADALGIQAEYGRFARAWNEIFWPQDGIDSLLDRLQGRYRMVVLSNINPIHAAHIRATVPLLARFDALLFSCEAGFAKPEAEVYAQAAALAGVPVARCLFIDDINEYVEAARATGMQGFQFTTVPECERRLVALGVLPDARASIR